MYFNKHQKRLWCIVAIFAHTHFRNEFVRFCNEDVFFLRWIFWIFIKKTDDLIWWVIILLNWVSMCLTMFKIYLSNLSVSEKICHFLFNFFKNLENLAKRNYFEKETIHLKTSIIYFWSWFKQISKKQDVLRFFMTFLNFYNFVSQF